MSNRYLPTLLSIFCLGTAWQIIALSIGYPALFPTLDQLIVEIFRLSLSGSFWAELGATVVRGCIGFAIATFFAFALSGIATFHRFWEAFFYPIVVIGRSLPVISLVLLALLWFSPTQLPVFVAIITMFPILYQHMLTGLQQTDMKLVQMASVFGKSPATIFVRVYLPSARENILSGFKTALGFGWRAVIMGEVLSQPIHGLGTAMKQAQTYINVPELIAWTVWAIVISYVFDGILWWATRTRFHHFFRINKFYHQAIAENNCYFGGIRINNLSKSYADKSILHRFSQHFVPKHIYYLKGTSGIGKTTLLHLISGIIKADSGDIQADGTFRLGYAFQEVRLLPWLTITENILFAGPVVEIQSLLKHSGLQEHANKLPHELSGGQLQRAGLIRALCTRPDVLLLDEPLTGLDSDTKKMIIELISEEITNYQPLVLWATHEEVEIKGMTAEEVVL